MARKKANRPPWRRRRYAVETSSSSASENQTFYDASAEAPEVDSHSNLNTCLEMVLYVPPEPLEFVLRREDLKRRTEPGTSAAPEKAESETLASDLGASSPKEDMHPNPSSEPQDDVEKSKEDSEEHVPLRNLGKKRESQPEKRKKKKKKAEPVVVEDPASEGEKEEPVMKDSEEPVVKDSEEKEEPVMEDSEENIPLRDLGKQKKSRPEKKKKKKKVAPIEVENLVSEEEKEEPIVENSEEDIPLRDLGKKRKSRPERRKKRKTTPVAVENLVSEGEEEEPVAKKPKRASASGEGTGGGTSRRKGKEVAREDTDVRSKRFKTREIRNLVEFYLTREMVEQRYVDFSSEDSSEISAIIKCCKLESTVDLEFLAPYVPEIICELYAHLPHEKTGEKEIKVWVRGFEYKFSAKRINQFLNFPVPNAEEMRQTSNCNKVSKNQVSQFLCQARVSWKDFATRKCPSRFASLWILAGYNWLPTKNRTHTSPDKARFIYQMAHGHRINFGELVYKRVLSRGWITYNKAGLYFPNLLYAFLSSQHPLPVLPNESFRAPIQYIPDKRSGKLFAQAHPIELSTDEDAAHEDSEDDDEEHQKYETMKIKVPVGKVHSVAAVEALRGAITSLQASLAKLEEEGENSSSDSEEF